MAGWGSQATSQTPEGESLKPSPAKVVYDKDYYRQQFSTSRAALNSMRMALVGAENTAKTGLAASLLHEEIMAGKNVYVFDVDNSAMSTLSHIYPDQDNIIVIPLHDEMDDSIYDENQDIDYHQLIKKTEYFINILAENIKNGEEVGGVIFDGGSTFLKWCEHAMRSSLLSKGVIEDEGDTFNQKEWRERNRLNRNILDRLHSLPVDKIFNTFHLKDVQEYMDDGTGKKVLMKVGERPEWDKGTMRRFSQQILLNRLMKKADPAAGVKGDKTLGEKQWVVRGTIEEMKGKNMEYVGTTHDILSVNDKNVEWFGLPFLTSGESDGGKNTKE